MILFDKQGKYLPLLNYQKEKQPEDSKLVNLEDERISETENTSQVTTKLIVAWFTSARGSFDGALKMKYI